MTSDPEKIIRDTGGKFFRVRFTKRTTGELRTMDCRTGVKKFAKGKSLPYDPAQKGLIPVWDLRAWDEKSDTGYRMIPIDNVLSITFSGLTHIFNNNFNERKKP